MFLQPSVAHCGVMLMISTPLSRRVVAVSPTHDERPPSVVKMGVP